MSKLSKDVFERSAATAVAAAGAVLVTVGPDSVDTWKFWGGVGVAVGVSLAKAFVARFSGNPDSASLSKSV